MESERIKSILVYFVTGGIWIGLVSATFAGLSSIGIDSQSDLTNIVTQFTTLNPVGIFAAIVAFLASGFLVWVVGHIGYHIRTAVGLQASKPAKRPFLVTMFLVGALSVVVLGAFGQILAGISPDSNLTEINSLLEAFSSQNPWAIAGVIFAYTGIGFIIGRLSNGQEKVDDYAPDKLKSEKLNI